MFESSTISKTCNPPFKKTQLPSVWKEHHLFEGNILLTKKNIESAASLNKLHNVLKNVTILSIHHFFRNM